MLTFFKTSFTRTARLKIVTAFLWCCTAAGLTFWFFQLVSDRAEITEHGFAEPASKMVSNTHVLQALGKSNNNESLLIENYKFAVFGLIASENSSGSALISINGEPPLAFTTGQVIVDDWILLSVTNQAANIHNRNSFSQLKIFILGSPAIL